MGISGDGDHERMGVLLHAAEARHLSGDEEEEEAGDELSGADDAEASRDLHSSEAVALPCFLATAAYR